MRVVTFFSDIEHNTMELYPCFNDKETEAQSDRIKKYWKEPVLTWSWSCF